MGAELESPALLRAVAPLAARGLDQRERQTGWARLARAGAWVRRPATGARPLCGRCRPPRAAWQWYGLLAAAGGTGRRSVPPHISCKMEAALAPWRTLRRPRLIGFGLNTITGACQPTRARFRGAGKCFSFRPAAACPSARWNTPQSAPLRVWLRWPSCRCARASTGAPAAAAAAAAACRQHAVGHFSMWAACTRCLPSFCPGAANRGHQECAARGAAHPPHHPGSLPRPRSGWRRRALFASLCQLAACCSQHVLLSIRRWRWQ